MIEELLRHHKIKHRTSTPYHPQANGKVEVTNMALESILTKVVSMSKKGWVERLVEATSAYNTNWKTTTGFTSYELIYGKNALMSIYFEYNTLRMEAQLDLDLSHAQKEILFQLNGLDEFRMYKDFNCKLMTRFLGPYVVERCHNNGSVQIRTIDEEAIPLLANGHQLKMYKRPLSKQEFIDNINKTVMMVEQVPAPPSLGH
eukprot:PITA_03870